MFLSYVNFYNILVKYGIFRIFKIINKLIQLLIVTLFCIQNIKIYTLFLYKTYPFLNLIGQINLYK